MGNKYWYQDVEDLYVCLEDAMEMITLIRKYGSWKASSFSDGIKHYKLNLYKIDYLYRKFVLHYRKSNQNRVLHPLSEKVEKVYTNDWLFQFNNEWQNTIDKLDEWTITPRSSQSRFFTDHVKPFITKGQRLFVIISDALRYECGWEYYQRMQNESRYNAEFDAMISTIPSYTKLGMAALLPQKQLSLQANSDNALIEGESTQGIKARTKILEKYAGVNAVAINAEDFMKMNSSTDGREFVKQYQLIYIYHNQIDKVGDDKTSEERVFEAVESEIDYLIDVVKKIANMNGNNMFITADHGFLYQTHALEESDF